jgi:TonB family protein
VLHGVFITALVLVPRDWLQTAPEKKSTPMMISLGPSGTAETGGMTAITSAPVQARTLPDAKPVITPPAAKTPEMVAPVPDVKPKPVVKPVSKPLDQSATKKPSTGPELKSGAARVPVPNASQVPFGGLAERAGKSAGGPQLDVADFCCPDYIETMVQRIRSNWDQQQGAAGQSIVKFTIRRDGMLTNVEVAKTSNNPLLDLASRLAVLNTRQLPPLPTQFDRPTLTVDLTFDYKR